MSHTQRSSWEVRPGQEIVPRRVAQCVLGGGARCEVVLAFNERLGRLVVLKVLRPSLIEDAGARRALAREADVLASLDHPGLPRLIDAGLDGSRPFIEMNHVAGPRLSTLVRRIGPLAADQAAVIARDLAGTLAWLHVRGFVHLDVKPSNVIVGERSYLVDLSTARLLERIRRIRGFVGTDAFMAPEQADSSMWPMIGPATDTWGLGATIYYTLAGRRPYPKGDRHGTGPARFPQLGEPPPRLDVAPNSARLVELIMLALARSPHARPTAADLVAKVESG